MGPDWAQPEETSYWETSTLNMDSNSEDGGADLPDLNPSGFLTFVNNKDHVRTQGCP